MYAALRIKKQLIARPGQRVGVDSFGTQYNIDRGNQTLVLQREAEMHSELDQRGLRWQKDKKNELFAPRKSVKELIDAMRTIRGEDMYLFDSETIREDTTYDGGRDRLELVMTQKRELPPRAARFIYAQFRKCLAKRFSLPCRNSHWLQKNRFGS